MLSRIRIILLSAFAAFCVTHLEAEPNRFESSIVKFEESDAQSMPPESAIVAVGSSSMRGWNKQIQEDLAPLTVIPRGFGGSQFSDVIHFYERVVLAYKPRAVLIYEGDNDVANGKSPEQIRDDFVHLVAICREKMPTLRFYVISVKPSIRRLEMWPQMVETNRLIAEVCATKPGLTYIDVAGPMLNDQGEPIPDIFLEDNLHMKRSGYEIWRDAVRPVVMEGEGPYEN